MERKSSGVGVLALIIAIVALILAWMAFNRTGADLEIMIEQEVQEAVEEIDNVNFEEIEEEVEETVDEAGDEIDEVTEEEPETATE